MDNSDSYKSLSTVEPKSRSNCLAQSSDLTDSSSYTSTSLVMPTSPMDYPIEHFPLMSPPHHVSYQGQVPNSSKGVKSSTMHMPNGNLYGLPTAQPSEPQYQPHAMIWPFIPQVQANVPSHGGSSGFVNPQAPGNHTYPSSVSDASRPTLQHISAVASTSQVYSPTSSVQDHSPIDPEEAAVIEDKRRRNTAASARFRIKKKQKNLNLERTVSDLTSRAEDLEREATNLRRENSWLKEMVIMKGKRNIAGIRSSYEEEATNGHEGDESHDETSEDSDVDHADRTRSDRSKNKGKNKVNESDGILKGKGGNRKG